jgi:hypothetical protein
MLKDDGEVFMSLRNGPNFATWIDLYEKAGFVVGN